MDNEVTTASALSERAMLSSLRMSCWLPPVIDKQVTRELARKYKVSEEEVRVLKYLIHPKTPSYAAVRTAMGSLRTLHYWYTLPWSHGGVQILPAVSFAEYASKMRSGIQTINEAVDVFCGEFPRLRKLAIAKSHGLIKREDFPTDIRSRFGVDFQLSPIPAVHDFRVQMADEDKARAYELMQAGVNQQVEEALKLAVREPYQRLYDHVQRMVERLTAKRKGGKEGVFHDTLVTGLVDLCNAMPALNITGDENLRQMAELARQMVANVNPEQLRDVPVIREKVAKDAAALRDLIAPHVADAPPPPKTVAESVLEEAAGIEAAMGGLMGFGT